ncbi:hypothetical protein JOB18_007530 [Solea senegalensis]|uniref:Uncharacterized protein n=1 Tax=Solea senegalensis TaxID=28829 RepID=A0AAV6PI70_SOLSE|nr:hypothetical protein JOB18_007530 [Solea senegalensis]KAG7466680.1 hypothetical protein JOB18_007530 [Solea senegalensis]KAG7466681.1 hypothetical protein JOB18_007530 [Solea senegalensis]
MQALCCELVCPRRAERRNGKDYPQECLGCPQTQRPRDRPMGSESAERRANVFLMNSAACSTERLSAHMVCVWSRNDSSHSACREKRRGQGAGGGPDVDDGSPRFHLISCGWSRVLFSFNSSCDSS